MVGNLGTNIIYSHYDSNNGGEILTTIDTYTFEKKNITIAKDIVFPYDNNANITCEYNNGDRRYFETTGKEYVHRGFWDTMTAQIPKEVDDDAKYIGGGLAVVAERGYKLYSDSDLGVHIYYPAECAKFVHDESRNAHFFHLPDFPGIGMVYYYWTGNASHLKSKYNYAIKNPKNINLTEIIEHKYYADEGYYTIFGKYEDGYRFYKDYLATDLMSSYGPEYIIEVNCSYPADQTELGEKLIKAIKDSPHIPDHYYSFADDAYLDY
jgi:hypothetical protein